jgi:alkylhydroperoxidase/carboxymuconolactone decarboxylase family protein YurZ
MGKEKTGCCAQGNQAAVRAREKEAGSGAVRTSVYKIVDKKVTLLIAAGAAMAANCEPCLNKIVADLKEAGVGTNDIRRAVEIGQFVKDKPAANMKQLADRLTGTRLGAMGPSEECPLEQKDQTCVCS